MDFALEKEIGKIVFLKKHAETQRYILTVYAYLKQNRYKYL